MAAATAVAADVEWAPFARLPEISARLSESIIKVVAEIGSPGSSYMQDRGASQFELPTSTIDDEAIVRRRVGGGGVNGRGRGSGELASQRQSAATTVQLLYGVGGGNAVLTLCCILAAAAAAVTSLPGARAVDCFKCSSRNGSNKACEDPFHNLNTTRITSMYLPEPTPLVVYHAPCYAGKKGRNGLFPASACIKMTGKFETTGETLIVRHCALDSGTLTQDTEISRISHCGKFRFEGDYLEGCVLACSDDACNAALPTASDGASGSLAVLTALTFALLALRQSLFAKA